MSIYVATGAYSYRAKVGSSRYSGAKSVTGTYGRNVAVPSAGSPFTLTARLPKAQARLVKAQVSVNGTSWTTRGQATSNSTGKVAIRTYLMATSYVRVLAPATGSLPMWVGPRGKVTIGTDPVIKKILDDTNAYRASQGKPALTLKASLNKVAGNWAYYMATKCVFKHNPNLTAQYPSGWKAAGENIAAGQPYTEVVNGHTPGVQPPDVDYGWIDSPPHRANILGNAQPGSSDPAPNYNYIGIGYFFGGSCGGGLQKSYVQNFARF